MFTLIGLCYTLNEAKPKTKHTWEQISRGYNSEQSEILYTHKKGVTRAKQQLGMIERGLHGATKKSPLVKYASSEWDPFLEYQIYDIEMVHTVPSGLYVTWKAGSVYLQHLICLSLTT